MQERRQGSAATKNYVRSRFLLCAVFMPVRNFFHAFFTKAKLKRGIIISSFMSVSKVKQRSPIERNQPYQQNLRLRRPHSPTTCRTSNLLSSRPKHASMEPLHQNVLACLATLVYIKVIVATCDTLLAKGLLAPDISRKIVHVRKQRFW